MDSNIQPLTRADIAWADVVFASAMHVQKESLRHIVERYKAHGKRVVIGGPYVTTGAEHLPPAGHLFLGEAETTVPGSRRPARRVAFLFPPQSSLPLSHFFLSSYVF